MENTKNARAMSELPTTGKITFAAYNNKTQLPVTLRPGYDKTGKLYTGQGESGYFENLTRDEKEKFPVIIDHETQYVLEDGKILDLDDPFDAAMWKWIQRHPYLALDKELGIADPKRDAVFYVVNAQKEARQYVDKTAKIDEARPAVRRLAATEQIKAAKALGLHAAETFPPAELLSWLLHEANRRPEAVLAVIDPANSAKSNATIFFNEASKFSVIERMRDGAFYFGGEKGVSIGITPDQVIDYLLAPENKERVKAMKAQLLEKTKVAPEKELEPATEHVI